MGSPNALSPVQGLQSPSTLDADLPPLALQTAAFFDETMSPKSPPMGLPAGFMPGSRRGSATPTPIPTPSRASTSTPMAEQSDQHTHERCKSIGACQTLIAIFSRLTFRPLRSDSDNRRQGVSIASKRSLALFHDVLGLLRPHHGGSGSNTARKMSVDELQSPLLHASCPRARLTLLQWLVRLRADTQHRVWVTSTVDTSYAAPILGRGSRDAAVPGSSSRPVATDQPERQGRSAKVAPIAETEERRRSGSRRREPSRPGRREASTARGRMPEQGSSRAVVEQPMWYNGDPVGFEAPQDTTPSSSMFTFDPQIVLTQPHDVSRFSNGVWLPVSDYLEVVVELLTDERADYELVSFLLCYLPVQLVNQHFFCGPRSTQELQVLLNHLAMWLGPSGQLPITRRLPATPGLRKSDVHAVAYQTLDVLVSYYRQFNSAHHRLLVRAFTTGISASDYMGKACIQALTMMATMAIPGPSKDTALAELRMAVTKDLPDIMEKLGKLTSNVSLAIHILEFVYAVSQNRDLYANFTSDQYRLPFAVALNIIRIHHESVTDSSTADVPTKVLSLHMLQFAYFVMYPWFLALNLGDRPKMARHILDQLTSAKQTLEEEDERSEVCLDFLHRYSYSNADPRPAPSFLAELALPEMEEGSAESRDVQVKLWSMGTSVIRIKTNRRSGWAQVDTLRPSGTTTMIVKVENIPIIDIGNEDADTKTSASVLLEGLPSRDKIELGHALGEPRTEEVSSLRLYVQTVSPPQKTQPMLTFSVQLLRPVLDRAWRAEQANPPRRACLATQGRRRSVILRLVWLGSVAASQRGRHRSGLHRPAVLCLSRRRVCGPTPSCQGQPVHLAGQEPGRPLPRCGHAQDWRPLRRPGADDAGRDHVQRRWLPELHALPARARPGRQARGPAGHPDRTRHRLGRERKVHVRLLGRHPHRIVPHCDAHAEPAKRARLCKQGQVHRQRLRPHRLQRLWPRL